MPGNRVTPNSQAEIEALQTELPCENLQSLTTPRTWTRTLAVLGWCIPHSGTSSSSAHYCYRLPLNRRHNSPAVQRSVSRERMRTVLRSIINQRVRAAWFSPYCHTCSQHMYCCKTQIAINSKQFLRKHTKRGCTFDVSCIRKEAC